MATDDVPGANRDNGDKLYPGCWAEHKDGSLLWVYEASDHTVVYSLFDLAASPPVEFRDALPRTGFDKEFSKKGWTWHDKHPEDFPWDKIMRNYPAGVRSPSADLVLSAAAHIARHRNLTGNEVAADEVVPSKAQRRVQKAIDKLQRALSRLPA